MEARHSETDARRSRRESESCKPEAWELCRERCAMYNGGDDARCGFCRANARLGRLATAAKRRAASLRLLQDLTGHKKMSKDLEFTHFLICKSASETFLSMDSFAVLSFLLCLPCL